MLTFTGFDNVVSLKSSTQQQVAELEEFARNDMEQFRDPVKPVTDYYGIYSKCRSSFKILPGYKFLLDALAQYCSKLCAVNEAAEEASFPANVKSMEKTKSNNQLNNSGKDKKNKKDQHEYEKENLDDARKKVVSLSTTHIKEFININKITLKSQEAQRLASIQVNVKVDTLLVQHSKVMYNVFSVENLVK